MDQNLQLHAAIIGQKTADALVKKGFSAEYLADQDEARKRLLELIPDGSGVGMGGSMTIKFMDIKGALEKKGCTIYDHNGIADPEEANAIRIKQLTCDVFLCSANAITKDGRLYNVDGRGNRVAAMIFGPGKVIVVAGINKIVNDLESADERVRMLAGPINNIRLNTGNPCTKTGVCADCAAPGRICNIATILHRRPSGANITVLLVGEALGY